MSLRNYAITIITCLMLVMALPAPFGQAAPNAVSFEARYTAVPYQPAVDFPSFGPPNAPVIMEVFLDIYQYSSRSIYHRLSQLSERHPSRLHVRLLLTARRPHNRWLAQAALVASEKGRFHEFLRAWYDHPRPNRKSLPQIARVAGVHPDAIKRALETGKHLQTIHENQLLANRFDFPTNNYQAQVAINGKVPSTAPHRMSLRAWEGLYDEAYATAKRMLAEGETSSTLPCALRHRAQTKIRSPSISRTALLVSRNTFKLPAIARPVPRPRVRVTIACNFLSTGCARLHTYIQELRNTYPRTVEIAFVPAMGRTTTNHALFLAHEAALCAHDQGAFWPYYDATYNDIDQYGTLRALYRDRLEARAKSLRLDRDEFLSCIQRRKHAQSLRSTLTQGKKQGINHTPSLIIGGRLYTATMPRAELFSLVRTELRPGLFASHLPQEICLSR